VVSGTPAPSAAAAEALQFGRGFTDVANHVLPSVVAIFVEIAERPDANMLVPLPGFGGANSPSDSARVRRGAGSGVILRADGAILTNNHVVEDATRIRVRLRDGRVFTAQVLGTDPATDLALVQIQANNLPVARLGDSDAAQVGEWVLAIGAPFGLEATVTHGVVSATGRGGIGASMIEDYLQTDASINPGNSGGPLVNMRGEVLGINTITVGRGSGVGFAVPSRLARFVAEQILAHGRVQRGWMGVSAQDVTPDLETVFHATSHGGALVNQLASDGPGAHAGIQVGDVILQVEEHAIHDEHDLVRVIASHGVGEHLRVALARQGQRREVTVTMGARPGESVAPAPAQVPPPQPGPTGFGIMIDTVPVPLAQRMGLPANTGVVVLQVFRGGAADRAGLRPGDVLLQADGAWVHGTDDVITAARDGRATLLVRRGDIQHFVGVGTEGAQ
jgi:S1-C subfamily serine protease